MPSSPKQGLEAALYIDRTSLPLWESEGMMGARGGTGADLPLLSQLGRRAGEGGVLIWDLHVCAHPIRPNANRNTPPRPTGHSKPLTATCPTQHPRHGSAPAPEPGKMAVPAATGATVSGDGILDLNGVLYLLVDGVGDPILPLSPHALMLKPW